MRFWCVIIVPKYLNSATFSKHLLAIFMSTLSNMQLKQYVGLPHVTSRPYTSSQAHNICTGGDRDLKETRVKRSPTIYCSHRFAPVCNTDVRNWIRGSKNICSDLMTYFDTTEQCNILVKDKTYTCLAGTTTKQKAGRTVSYQECGCRSRVPTAHRFSFCVFSSLDSGRPIIIIPA
jgi:hypothetical protein